jgi:hypothetical protein
VFFDRPVLHERTAMEKEKQLEKLTVRELEETALRKAAAKST